MADLTSAFSAFQARPQDFSSYLGGKGYTSQQSDDRPLWYSPEGNRMRPGQLSELEGLFTRESTPEFYMQQADPRFMPYARGTSLDSPAGEEYQKIGMKTIRDALRRYDPGFNEQNWLAPGTAQNPFDIPAYLRSDQYNYGKDNPITEKDQGPMAMMALAAIITAGMAAAGMGAAGAGASQGGMGALGAGGAMDMGVGLAEVASQMGVGAGGMGATAGAGAGGFAGGVGDLMSLANPSANFATSMPGISTIGNPAMGAIPGGSIAGAAPWAAAGVSPSEWALQQLGSAALPSTGGGEGMAQSGEGVPVETRTPNWTKSFENILQGNVPLSMENLGAASMRSFSPANLVSNLFNPGGSGNRSPLDMAMSVGSGIYGLSLAERQRKMAQQAMERADPFGPYRGAFGEKLMQLYSNPNSIFDMPGYKAGEQAVQRTMAGQGYLGSGNMMLALQKYGGDFFDKEVARLAGLSGANFNPASAAGFGMQGESNAAEIASRALASMGYGLSSSSPTQRMLEAALMRR